MFLEPAAKSPTFQAAGTVGKWVTSLSEDLALKSWKPKSPTFAFFACLFTSKLTLAGFYAYFLASLGLAIMSATVLLAHTGGPCWIAIENHNMSHFWGELGSGWAAKTRGVERAWLIWFLGSFGHLSCPLPPSFLAFFSFLHTFGVRMSVENIMVYINYPPLQVVLGLFMLRSIASSPDAKTTSGQIVEVPK